MTEISNPFICKICNKPFVEPQCLKCGHTFCRNCIDQIVDNYKKKNCPICDTKFNRKEFTIVLDLIASQKNINYLEHKTDELNKNIETKQMELNKNIETKRMELEKASEQLTNIEKEIIDKRLVLNKIDNEIKTATDSLHKLYVDTAEKNGSLEKQLILVKYYIKNGFPIYKNDKYIIFKFKSIQLIKQTCMSKTEVQFLSYHHKHRSREHTMFSFCINNMNELSKQLMVILLTY